MSEKTLFEPMFLSAQIAMQSKTERCSLLQAAYSISTHQEAAGLFR